MRVVLPFKLVGQKLVKGRDFPKSVADGSKDSIVIKVGGIPDGCIAKGYFKLSWESNTTYDLTFNGDELVVAERIVTLPANANNKYIDYKFSFSVAIWEGDVERLTTNPVEIVVEKSNYVRETTNTPDIPESQYDEILSAASVALSTANEAQKTASAAQNLANGLDGTVDELLEAKGDHEERLTKLEDGGGLPNATAEDNDKVLTVVNGEPQWALHAGISNKQKVVFADDGEGNVSIVLVEGDEEGGELEERVDKVEATLYGAQEKPTVETVNITNLLTNSQFDSDMTGWSLVYQGEQCTAAVVDGVLTVNFTGANEHIRQRFANQDAIVIGHRYYIYTRCRFTGGNPVTENAVSKAYFTGTGMQVTDEDIVHPTVGDWGYMSRAFTVTGTTSSKYCSIWILYRNATDGNGSVVYIDNIAAIDLTAAFGEGNEPDRATMDKWMQEQYPYGFEGTANLTLTTEDEDDGEDGGLVGKVEALDGAVAELAETIKNLPISDLVQMGTVYPVLEDYYIENIKDARPVYYDAQDAGTLTFAMLSDQHLSKHDYVEGLPVLKNVEASSVWAKLVNHDFVVMGGDFIVGDEPKAASLGYIDALMEMAEKHARCPVYAVKGNHDSCSQTGDRADVITQKEFYMHAHARGEKHGMVIDPAHPYAGYYYVDFPKQKIRMVCLNTSEIKEGVDILTASNYIWSGVKSTYQAEWVRDVALRVPEGWAVMIVSHIPPIVGEDLGVADTGDNADAGAPFHNRGVRSSAIVAMCKAFAEGASGTANVTESGSEKITYDFTEQGAREFIGHFCGHVHEDSQSVYNGLNYVVVNSTVPVKRWSTSLDRTDDKDKLSLNSFIVDRATRTVKCIKIGSSPAADNEWWSDSFTWNEVSV